MQNRDTTNPSLKQEGTGATIGAFFDMDNTLLRASSGRLYLRYLWQKGYLAWHEWAQVAGRVGLYIIGVFSFPAIMSHLTIEASGASEEEAWRQSREWYDAMLQYYIAAVARERVAWHQAQGHHIAIVSASTPYAVQPVALALGLGEAYLATRLEVVDGRFTGKVIEPACYDEGKLSLTRAYAASHGIDLSQSYFYSDSHRDLPLLQAVGHPVAVNPNARLTRIATKRSWPIVYFY